MDDGDLAFNDDVINSLDITPVLRDQIGRIASEDGVQPWEFVKRAVRIAVARRLYRERDGQEAPSDDDALKVLQELEDQPS